MSDFRPMVYGNVSAVAGEIDIEKFRALSTEDTNTQKKILKAVKFSTLLQAAYSDISARVSNNDFYEIDTTQYASPNLITLLPTFNAANAQYIPPHTFIDGMRVRFRAFEDNTEDSTNYSVDYKTNLSDVNKLTASTPISGLLDPNIKIFESQHGSFYGTHAVSEVKINHRLKIAVSGGYFSIPTQVSIYAANKIVYDGSNYYKIKTGNFLTVDEKQVVEIEETTSSTYDLLVNADLIKDNNKLTVESIDSIIKDFNIIFDPSASKYYYINSVGEDRAYVEDLIYEVPATATITTAEKDEDGTIVTILASINSTVLDASKNIIKVLKVDDYVSYSGRIYQLSSNSAELLPLSYGSGDTLKNKFKVHMVSALQAGTEYKINFSSVVFSPKNVTIIIDNEHTTTADTEFSSDSTCSITFDPGVSTNDFIVEINSLINYTNLRSNNNAVALSEFSVFKLDDSGDSDGENALEIGEITLTSVENAMIPQSYSNAGHSSNIKTMNEFVEDDDITNDTQILFVNEFSVIGKDTDDEYKVDIEVPADTVVTGFRFYRSIHNFPGLVKIQNWHEEEDGTGKWQDVNEEPYTLGWNARFDEIINIENNTSTKFRFIFSELTKTIDSDYILLSAIQLVTVDDSESSYKVSIMLDNDEYIRKFNPQYETDADGNKVLTSVNTVQYASIPVYKDTYKTKLKKQDIKAGRIVELCYCYEYDKSCDVTNPNNLDFPTKFGAVKDQYFVLMNPFENKDDDVGNIIITADSDFSSRPNYLKCDGSLVSSDDYPELFNKIGYAYGKDGTEDDEIDRCYYANCYVRAPFRRWWYHGGIWRRWIGPNGCYRLQRAPLVINTNYNAIPGCTVAPGTYTDQNGEEIDCIEYTLPKTILNKNPRMRYYRIPGDSHRYIDNNTYERIKYLMEQEVETGPQRKKWVVGDDGASATVRYRRWWGWWYGWGSYTAATKFYKMDEEMEANKKNLRYYYYPIGVPMEETILRADVRFGNYWGWYYNRFMASKFVGQYEYTDRNRNPQIKHIKHEPRGWGNYWGNYWGYWHYRYYYWNNWYWYSNYYGYNRFPGNNYNSLQLGNGTSLQKVKIACNQAYNLYGYNYWGSVWAAYWTRLYIYTGFDNDPGDPKLFRLPDLRDKVIIGAPEMTDGSTEYVGDQNVSEFRQYPYQTTWSYPKVSYQPMNFMIKYQ